MIHFTYYTSVYDPIFTCDSSLLLHNMSLTTILGQPTYGTWCKHIDPFCLTLSCVPYFSLFPLHLPSSTPFHGSSLTSVCAKSIQKHLLRCSHSGAWCRWLHQPWLYFQPSSQLHSHWDDGSHRSSSANFRCQKVNQVHYTPHFRLYDSWFSSFDQHLMLPFVLHAGFLPTTLLGKVIFLTIWMQLHHHVESLTRMLWQYLQYLKCILQLSFVCFEHDIPSM